MACTTTPSAPAPPVEITPSRLRSIWPAPLSPTSTHASAGSYPPMITLAASSEAESATPITPIPPPPPIDCATTPYAPSDRKHAAQVKSVLLGLDYGVGGVIRKKKSKKKKTT